MTVNVTKPALNIREKLAELDFAKVPFQKMPAGSVVQVVTHEWATYSSSTSTSYVNINGATVSITPKFANSIILVQTAMPSMFHNVGGGTSLGLILLRDGIQIWGGDRYVYTDRTGWNTVSMVVNYDDSPATTSSTTYSLQAKVSTSGSSVRVNDYYQSATVSSVITLMEIAQ